MVCAAAEQPEGTTLLDIQGNPIQGTDNQPSPREEELGEELAILLAMAFPIGEEGPGQ